MTPYEQWKVSHKLNLRAYTEEEIFGFGYDARQPDIDRLNKVIEALNSIIEEPAAAPKKAKKNEPVQVQPSEDSQA